MSFTDDQNAATVPDAAPNAGPVKSWLDDFWTVVLVLPCLLAFVPGLQEVVSRGFQIIGQDIPAWYLAALGASLAAAFGKQVLPGGIAPLMRPKP
jgi:hypothetical protein